MAPEAPRVLAVSHLIGKSPSIAPSETLRGYSHLCAIRARIAYAEKTATLAVIPTKRLLAMRANREPPDLYNFGYWCQLSPAVNPVECHHIGV